MKRIIPLVLAVCLLICGCAVDEELVTPVANNFSGLDDRNYSFVLRIERIGKGCILLSDGALDYSASAKKVEGEMSQTLMGNVIGKSEVAWQDGFLVSDGEKTEMSWEDLNKSLIYAPPMVFDMDTIKKASQTQTIDGTMYVHEIKDDTKGETLFDLLGEALPGICGVAKLIKEETRFEDIVCRYTLDGEGKPVGYNITFTVIYQDTPPYVPGVTQDKDDYTVSVSVDFRATFK